MTSAVVCCEIIAGDVFEIRREAYDTVLRSGGFNRPRKISRFCYKFNGRRVSWRVYRALYDNAREVMAKSAERKQT